MTREEEKLYYEQLNNELREDLGGRLGTDTKVKHYRYRPDGEILYSKTVTLSKNVINNIGEIFEEYLPYLIPMSSMTDQQQIEYEKLKNSEKPWDIVKWLNKNHFDYNGLIERDLAIDASTLNIY